jgi:hypothetical protein
MSREHEEMLARVRVSDRMWSESDLYYRTNRWVEDGRSQDASDSFAAVKMADFAIVVGRENVGRSTVIEAFNQRVAQDIRRKLLDSKYTTL